jgi:IS605 OrfB family transposase
MKLTTKIKLNPTLEQGHLVRSTIETSNQICDEISKYAFEKKNINQYDLHKLVYHPIKEKFNAGSQQVVRAIGKVFDSYKLNKTKLRKFKKYGAVPYDSRMITFNPDGHYVSLWANNKRIKIPYLCSDAQAESLRTQKGETDLVYVSGNFYLYCTYEITPQELAGYQQVLGVDLGINNIAATSDGVIYSGDKLKNVRSRYQKLREKLQKKSSKSAIRLLKKRKRKESNFVRDTNHVISKLIVRKAKGTASAIALENLKGIRQSGTVRRKDRFKHQTWSFFQLKQFITYKAELAGVTVIGVNPAYTSQRCFACGLIRKANRRGPSYKCGCGYENNSDVNGALNIAVKGAAAVNLPNVVNAGVKPPV